VLGKGQLIDGHLRWALETHRRGAVITVGRLDRQALSAKPVSLTVPEELIAEISAMTEGGGTQAAYLALLVFAVETLKAQKLQMRMSVCGTEVPAHED
jgi:hypothetical protein